MCPQKDLNTKLQNFEDLRIMLTTLQLVMRLFLVLLATRVAAATATLVVLGHNRGADAFNLLVLLLDLLGVGLWVRVEPRLPVMSASMIFSFSSSSSFSLRPLFSPEPSPM